MNQLVKVQVNWAIYSAGGSHPAQSLLDGIHAKLQELRRNKSATVDAHLRSDECSYVYWGCGSCPDGGARVDAYCSSGSSEPDMSWCEGC